MRSVSDSDEEISEPTLPKKQKLSSSTAVISNTTPAPSAPKGKLKLNKGKKVQSGSSTPTTEIISSPKLIGSKERKIEKSSNNNNDQDSTGQASSSRSKTEPTISLIDVKAALLLGPVFPPTIKKKEWLRFYENDQKLLDHQHKKSRDHPKKRLLDQFSKNGHPLLQMNGSSSSSGSSISGNGTSLHSVTGFSCSSSPALPGVSSTGSGIGNYLLDHNPSHSSQKLNSPGSVVSSSSSVIGHETSHQRNISVPLPLPLVFQMSMISSFSNAPAFSDHDSSVKLSFSLSICSSKA